MLVHMRQVLVTKVHVSSSLLGVLEPSFSFFARLFHVWFEVGFMAPSSGVFGHFYGQLQQFNITGRNKSARWEKKKKKKKKKIRKSILKYNNFIFL